MTHQEFMDALGRNIARVKEYKLGMDGRGGQCDCIGLIIGAVRLAGGQWSGTHGSNYAARYQTRALQPLSSAGSLQVGQLVFKAYEPGESGHALPAAYKGHEDQRDYYHVGVVTGVNPLEITHCTSVAGGISRDKKLGKWRWAGFLRQVFQETGEGAAFRVTGGRLNLRSGPGKGFGAVASLPEGTCVTARPLAETEAWMEVFHEDRQGYAMARYLQPVAACKARDLATLLEQALQLARSLQGGEAP